jgi:RNA-directed DNA polymerase
LCNIALNGLEGHVKSVFPAHKDVNGKKPKVNIYRFADDLIVTGNNEEILSEIKKSIAEFLKIRGLELKDSKTRIVSIHTGFDFLGFNITRKPYNPRLNKITQQKTVLIIKPADKAVVSIKAKLKQIFLNYNEIIAIIREINPLLRG